MGDVALDDGLLTLAEAAEEVGVSVGTVRLWVSRGQVRTREWDGTTYLIRSSVRECEYARRTRGVGGRPRARAAGRGQ